MKKKKTDDWFLVIRSSRLYIIYRS